MEGIGDVHHHATDSRMQTVKQFTGQGERGSNRRIGAEAPRLEMFRAPARRLAGGSFFAAPGMGSRQEVRRARSMPSPLLARQGER